MPEKDLNFDAQRDFWCMAIDTRFNERVTDPWQLTPVAAQSLSRIRLYIKKGKTWPIGSGCRD